VSFHVLSCRTIPPWVTVVGSIQICICVETDTWVSGVCFCETLTFNTCSVIDRAQVENSDESRI
jgi:hypothetical protein